MPIPLRHKNIAAIITLLPLLFGFAQDTRALDGLTAHELAAHCEHLASDPDGVDGQYCIHYIQGFIDGAVETDERIMQDMAPGSGGSTLTERAMRTRMPRQNAYNRPGSLAGFCLGDPLLLRDIVDTVVADLTSRDIRNDTDSPARVAVDDALRRHYPCAE